MLSSNWYVTLRFTVFEIFAVKQPKFRTKISNLRTQWVPPPKGEKICPGPICTIMQNFEPVGATVAEISVTGQRKNKCVSKTHINKHGGAVKTMCNTPPPFQGRHLRR